MIHGIVENCLSACDVTDFISDLISNELKNLEWKEIVEKTTYSSTSFFMYPNRLDFHCHCFYLILSWISLTYSDVYMWDVDSHQWFAHIQVYRRSTSYKLEPSYAYSKGCNKQNASSFRLRRTLKSLEKGIYPTMEDLQRQLTCIAVLLDTMSTSDEERLIGFLFV